MKNVLYRAVELSNLILAGVLYYFVLPIVFPIQ